jgi:hypothetical protein
VLHLEVPIILLLGEHTQHGDELLHLQITCRCHKFGEATVRGPSKQETGRGPSCLRFPPGLDGDRGQGTEPDKVTERCSKRGACEA